MYKLYYDLKVKCSFLCRFSVLVDPWKEITTIITLYYH